MAIVKTIKMVFLLTIISLLSSGCASSGASENANAASDALAREAMGTAENAEAMAEDALSAVKRLEEKVDRMFEKAMRK